VLVCDLPGRVATEDIRFAEGCGQVAKPLLERIIELGNRLVIVIVGWSTCWRWFLNLQEGLNSLKAETK
jgi:hypothetical protein